MTPRTVPPEMGLGFCMGCVGELSPRRTGSEGAWGPAALHSKHTVFRGHQELKGAKSGGVGFRCRVFRSKFIVITACIQNRGAQLDTQVPSGATSTPAERPAGGRVHMPSPASLLPEGWKGQEPSAAPWQPGTGSSCVPASLRPCHTST